MVTTSSLIYFLGTIAAGGGSFCHGFSFHTTVAKNYHVSSRIMSLHHQPKQVKHYRHRQLFALYSKQLDNDHEDNNKEKDNNDDKPLSRRDALTKALFATAAVAASTLTTANPTPANAAIDLPTRIELQVETDYLIRVLNYFDGDMRKALGALVRSPFTKVQIDPPNSIFTADRDAARDAILRALYSYDRPEDYISQVKWLKIENKKPSVLRSTISWFTKKRYTIDLNDFKAGTEKEEDNFITRNFSEGSGTISLSNLEIGGTAVAVSYPLAYWYYQYESYKEEEEAKAKKAALAAKRKAAAEKKKKDTAAKAKKEEGGDKPPAAAAAKKKDATPETAEKKPETSPAPVAEKKEEAPAPVPKKEDAPPAVAPPVVAAAAVEEKPKLETATPPPPPPPPATIEIESTVKENQFEDTAPVSSTTPPRVVTKTKSAGGMDAYAAQYEAMLAAANKRETTLDTSSS